MSRGCIHLYPEDILQLYNMVPVGTQERVVNQPFVFGWHRGDLYTEAFGPLAGYQRDWKNAIRKLLERALGPQMETDLRERNEQVRWGPDHATGQQSDGRAGGDHRSQREPRAGPHRCAAGAESPAGRRGVEPDAARYAVGYLTAGPQAREFPA